MWAPNTSVKFYQEKKKYNYKTKSFQDWKRCV